MLSKVCALKSGDSEKYEIIFTKKFADKKKVYIFALA